MKYFYIYGKILIILLSSCFCKAQKIIVEITMQFLYRYSIYTKILNLESEKRK